MNIEEYKEVRDEYLRISEGSRNKLTALSLAVIGAIYVFSDKNLGEIFFLKLALICYILVTVIEVFANYAKSQHYLYRIEEKINSIDFSESIWGKISEYLFWLPLIVFILGTYFL